MAINLGSKYSTKIAERFSKGSFTDAHSGHDYEFTGVKTIKIYSIDTVNNANYTRSGTTRFGTLTELGDTIQEMTLTRDRAFTFSIDAGNANEQFNIKHANACLKRQWDEVCTPEIDKYRLNAWVSGNGLSSGFAVTTKVDGALSKQNIVDLIFNANAQMSDDMVPTEGRTLYISEKDFVKFKLSDLVTGSEIAGKTIEKGYKGTIDGNLHVVTVPSTYMPTDVNFIIKLKNATVDPMTLKNLRVHKNPMGVDGDVVEGRFIYDSFVLDNKAKGIYVSKVK